MADLAGKRIVVGVCGGIAAYKAVEVIRRLVDAGAHVIPIMTKGAEHFIGRTTLSALASEPVQTSLWDEASPIPHTKLGQGADLVLIAPATARLLGAYANGLSTDLMTNVLIATRAPVIVCPAMHTEMWENPSTVANVATLRARGINVLEPAVGRLTGEDSGKGRMPEPEAIVEAALNIFVAQDLTGVKVLITAGGTREPIDSVRFIGNNSSGLMGFALYKAAKSRGADVQLVAANLQPDLTEGQVNVSTTEELRESLNNHVAGTDVLIMAAAVSDYRVENPSAAKLKKADLGSTPVLNLVENPDLLAEIGAKRASGRSITLIGFAAETLAGDDLVASARKKLEAKKVDLVVANDVTGGAVFGSDATAIKLVSENEELSFAGSKLEAANAIIDWIVTARK